MYKSLTKSPFLARLSLFWQANMALWFVSYCAFWQSERSVKVLTGFYVGMRKKTTTGIGSKETL